MSLPNPTFIGQQETVEGKTYQAVSVNPPVWKGVTTGTHGRRLDILEKNVLNVASLGLTGDYNQDASDILESITLQPHTKLLFPSGVYRVTRTITIQVPDYVTVEAFGALFVYDGVVDQTALIFEGVSTHKGTFTLAAPTFTIPEAVVGNVYTKGVRKFELVGDVTAIEPEDWLQFYSTRKFNVGATKQTYEVNRCWQVTGQTLYTDGESKVAFSAGDVVEARSLTKGFVLKGGNFDANNLADNTVIVRYFNKPKITAQDYFNLKVNGLYVQYCCEDSVIDVQTHSAGQTPSPESEYAGSSGYGVIHARSCFSSVSSCGGGSGWHSFEAADGQRDITYYDCHAIADSHGFSTHENCVSASYINCSSKARLPMIQRCRYLEVQGGSYTKTGTAASFSFSGWEAIVDGITYTCLSNSGGNHFRLSDIDATNSNMNEPESFTTKVQVSNSTFNMLNGDCKIGNNTAVTETVVDNCNFNGVSCTWTIHSTGDTTVKNSRINGKLLGAEDISRGYKSSTPVSLSGKRIFFKNNEAVNLNSAGNSITNNDLVNLVPPSGEVTYEFHTDNNTVVQQAIRYVFRSLSGTCEVFHTDNKYINGSVTASWSLILFGMVQTTTNGNVFDTTITRAKAYHEAGGNIVKGGADVFKEYDTVVYASIPTSLSGLPAGAVWNDAGFLKIV